MKIKQQQKNRLIENRSEVDLPEITGIFLELNSLSVVNAAGLGSTGGPLSALVTLQATQTESTARFCSLGYKNAL